MAPTATERRSIAIDTSALIAMHYREPGHERLFQVVIAAELVIVSTAIIVDAALVLGRRLSTDPRPVLMRDLATLNARIVPFNETHMQVAIDAFLRFGKGRHPAQLNFGDCLSYALASVAGLPLLYTGNDFSKTDIEAA